ncbi:MAG TPA: hypothetical protein VEI97_20145 [bacterium]|nr:hypothetical protein [bacterium]
MFRTLTLISLLALGVAGPALAGDDMDKGKDAKDMDKSAAMAETEAVTLEGTFVDGGCFLSRGAADEEHNECAVACLKGGGMLGFVADDQFYVVANANPMESDTAVRDFNEQFVDWVGRDVRVTGEVMESHGIHLLTLATVQNPKNGKIVIDLESHDEAHHGEEG